MREPLLVWTVNGKPPIWPRMEVLTPPVYVASQTGRFQAYVRFGSFIWQDEASVFNVFRARLVHVVEIDLLCPHDKNL